VGIGGRRDGLDRVRTNPDERQPERLGIERVPVVLRIVARFPHHEDVVPIHGHGRPLTVNVIGELPGLMRWQARDAYWRRGHGRYTGIDADEVPRRANAEAREEQEAGDQSRLLPAVDCPVDDSHTEGTHATRSTPRIVPAGTVSMSDRASQTAAEFVKCYDRSLAAGVHHHTGRIAGSVLVNVRVP